MIKIIKSELINKQKRNLIMTRLAEEFKSNIKPRLMEKFKYKNIHQIPKITKIILNMGIGEAKDDSKILIKLKKN